jgi:probable HAF family extracellular repeat protein
MKSRRVQWLVVASLLAAVALPTRMLAQANAGEDAGGRNHAVHYTVSDLGTLGGSFSLAYGINEKGEIDGFSTIPGDLAEHAFLLKDGALVDLGTLGGLNSQTFAGLSNREKVVGSAEIPTPDPNAENFCGFFTSATCLPFLWQDGVMSPLKTLGGTNGQAADINEREEVAGYAETATADPGCTAPQTLQFRPVLWRKDDVETLPLFPGDAEGAAFWINSQGEAVGASGPCAPYDPRYGLPLQPEHALLWRKGKLVDLGSLGGAMNNAGFAINNFTEIAGASDLPSDTYQHAFLWRRGVMRDLGVLPGDVVSAAVALNNRGQVVGVSNDINGNSRAFLWERGELKDLNNYIPVGSPLYLVHSFGINDRGQIVGLAVVTSTGEAHGFLATPIACEENGQDDCVATDDGSSEISQTAKFAIPENARKQIRRWAGSRRFMLLGTNPQ